jgi:hypothetical protein
MYWYVMVCTSVEYGILPGRQTVLYTRLWGKTVKPQRYVLVYWYILIGTSMVGCTILHAVSGILWTHCGRRGSELGRLLAGAIRVGSVRLCLVGYCLLCLRSWPVLLLYWPVWPLYLPVWLASLFALCPCGLPLSPGRRRALLTSNWPWAFSLAARWRAGSPARIATAIYVGVQWGGLGLALLRVDRRQRRVL